MFRSELHFHEAAIAFRCGPMLFRTSGASIANTTSVDRIALMLTVAYRRPIHKEIFDHINAAVKFWNSSDKALANLRLIFAGLSEMDDQEDISRLIFAERLLNTGMLPASICEALDAREMAKFNPGERRVPAGSGPTSGRWAAAWSAIQHWLNEMVPEYDLDTGEQIGTRTRARALLTNPLTVGAAAAAALLGGEALLGPAAAGEVLAPPAASRFAVDAARGLASEAKVLEDLGLTRNTQVVRTAEGRSIPDALTDRLSVEIKDREYVTGTKQLRIQTEAASVSGRKSILITGTKTQVSGPARRIFDQIRRRNDLGPK
jgi:hypothetical protein